MDENEELKNQANEAAPTSEGHVSELKPVANTDKPQRAKRGRKKKQAPALAEQDGAQPAQASMKEPKMPLQQPGVVNYFEVPSTPEKPKRKKGMARRPKLQKFDYILLQLLKEGRNSLVEVMRLVSVDPTEFRERIRVLEKRKLITLDPVMNSVHLSVKAVNEYKPGWKAYADSFLSRSRQAQTPEEEKTEAVPTNIEILNQQENAAASDPLQTHLTNTIIELPENHAAPIPTPEEARRRQEAARINSSLRDAVKPAHPQKTENNSQENIDLTDVIRKFGPNAEQARKMSGKTSPFIEHMYRRETEKAAKMAASPQAQAPQTTQTAKPIPRSPMGAATQQQTGQAAVKPSLAPDMCGLCRTEFSVSVDPKNNRPKYGHCFCGESYHRDCFDSILASNATCINCGRRLSRAIDLASEDEMRQIKELFQD